MKKRRFPWFLVGFLVLLGLAYGGFAWYCYVPVKDPATLAAVEAGVADRLAAQEKIPAEDNGFEELRPIWGFKTDEGLDDQRYASLRALPAFCVEHDCFFTLSEMRKVLKEQGPGLLAAEKQSDSEYPALIAALEKPAFFYPTKLEVHDQVPNLVAIRSACQLLAARAALRAVQGRAGEGALPLLLGVRMGARLGQNGGTLAQAIGISSMAISLAPLEEMLGENLLKPQECKALLPELAKIPFEAGDYVKATDSELVVGLNGLRRFEFAHEPGLAMTAPPVIGPLFTNREKGLLVNLYLERRPKIEKLEPVPNPPEDAYPWDRAVGLLEPNNPRLLLQFKLMLVKLAAVRAMATLGAGEPMPEGTGLDYKKVGQDYELSFTADWLNQVHRGETIHFHPPEQP